MYPWKYIGLIGLMLVGFFIVALYLKASATGFHWGRASRWSQIALMACAFFVVLTMVTMGYTRETARRVDNDPGYLINGCVKLDQSDRQGRLSDNAHYGRERRMMELALLLQEGSTGDPTAIGIFRFFAGFVLIVTVYTSFLGFTYWISKDE